MTETEHSSKNSPWPIILAVIVLTVPVAALGGLVSGGRQDPWDAARATAP